MNDLEIRTTHRIYILQKLTVLYIVLLLVLPTSMMTKAGNILSGESVSYG